MVDVQTDEVSIEVPWRRWGAEAFREAQERGVPILLSIGATWCHWCHVMDEGTYGHPEVIRRLATDLVPVRVNSDRRPDINNRYNLGGWPTTALLTPDGVTLSGGTYMPAEELLGVIDDVLRYCCEKRAELEQRLERRGKRRARIAELRGRLRGDVTPETVDVVAGAVKEAYDAEYGGFGQAPKFPVPDTLEFALAIGHARCDEELLAIARQTLTAMAEGGMYDRVAGGFFRYSTTADWSIPHYEKMLDANARLLAVYLHGAQVLDEPLYRETARGVLSFAEATLRTSEGAYGGSAKADEEYYHLRADARAERNPPVVDATLFTDWNAMMISASLKAAAILDESFTAELALEALEAIWQRSYAPKVGLAHYYDGSAQLSGLLADQAWMGHALLDAHAYVGQGDYLARAKGLMGVMLTRLLNPDGGGFFDIPLDPAALGRLGERLKLLDENAIAADLALRMHRLTGREDYYEAALSALEAMAPLYRNYRHHAAAYGLAVYRFTHAPLRLIIVGDPVGERARALRVAALGIYDPNAVVESVDPAVHGERLQELGLPAEPAPALYVRRGEQTSPAIRDVAEVRGAVDAVPA